MKSEVKKTGTAAVYSILTIGAVLVLWFVISNYTDIPSIILPTPQAVAASFGELWVHGYGTNRDTLAVHLLASGQRLLIAFVLSVLTAVPLGLLSGCFVRVSAVLSPLVEFYRPIPPLAYYTILVLWLGITETSKITLLFLAGFAPVFISCSASVRKISEDYLRASCMLGANRLQTFFQVILPASLPDIFTGIRTAIGVEYTTLVAAEMVAAKTGVGWMVLDASNWLKSDVIFVGVILMGITGILLNLLILWTEKTLVHWSGK